MADAAAALAKVPFRVTDPERIPTERYYDPEFFELERKHVWPKVWQMACAARGNPQCRRLRRVHASSTSR